MNDLNYEDIKHLRGLSKDLKGVSGVGMGCDTSRSDLIDRTADFVQEQLTTMRDDVLKYCVDNHVDCFDGTVTLPTRWDWYQTPDRYSVIRHIGGLGITIKHFTPINLIVFQRLYNSQ